MRYATITVALLCCVAAIAGVSKDELQSSFRDCAKKAIEGKYGEIPYWKYRGYELGLQKMDEVKFARAGQTIYYPSEGFPRGQDCRYGIGVSERVVASNTLPARTYAFFIQPHKGQRWCHLRQVYDTGASWNDRRWRAYFLGKPFYTLTDFWVDVWVPQPGWMGFSDNQVLNMLYFENEQ